LEKNFDPYALDPTQTTPNSSPERQQLQLTLEMLRPDKEQCLTLTFDNGKEFADHVFFGNCVRAGVFFAHPYSISKSSVKFVGFASRTFVLSSLRLRVHT
jgi:hypothetical protein